jgi:hypothetical protein
MKGLSGPIHPLFFGRLQLPAQTHWQGKKPPASRVLPAPSLSLSESLSLSLANSLSRGALTSSSVVSALIIDELTHTPLHCMHPGAAAAGAAGAAGGIDRSSRRRLLG